MQATGTSCLATQAGLLHSFKGHDKRASNRQHRHEGSMSVDTCMHAAVLLVSGGGWAVAERKVCVV